MARNKPVPTAASTKTDGPEDLTAHWRRTGHTGFCDDYSDPTGATRTCTTCGDKVHQPHTDRLRGRALALAPKPGDGTPKT